MLRLALTISFLGFLESGITPALVLITSQYWKTSEQGTRTGIWFSFNAWGGIFGALLAFGLYRGDRAGVLPIAGWKLVFIILGCITILVGILFLVFIPDTPDRARFLTREEKTIAIERIRANQQGIIHRVFRKAHVIEALSDPFVRQFLVNEAYHQNWLYIVLSLIVSIINGGFTK